MSVYTLYTYINILLVVYSTMIHNHTRHGIDNGIFSYSLDTSTTEIPLYVILILSCLTLTMLAAKYKLTTHNISLILGCIAGVMIYVSNQSGLLEPKILESRNLYIIFGPLLLIRMIYNMDVYIFYRSLSQIILIGTLGYGIFITTFGFLLVVFNSQKLSVINVILAGVSMAPIEIPTSIMRLERMRHVQVLLIGETIVGNTLCWEVFDVGLGLYSGIVSHTYQVFNYFVKTIISSIILGGIGKLIADWFLRYSYDDTKNLMAFIISAPYCLFFICEQIVDCSGLVAATILLICIVQHRQNFPASVDSDIENFIYMIYVPMSRILYFTLSVYLTIQTCKLYKKYEVIEALAVYIVGYAARLLMFLVLSPILSRIGVGFDILSMVTILWGSRKSLLQFIIILQLYQTNYLNYIGKKIVCYCLVDSLLTGLINELSLKPLIQKFGYIELSVTRKKNINNCMKQLNQTRINKISFIKMNRAFADANWPLIYNTTHLENRYKFSDEEEFDVSQRMQNLLCPSCLKTIPVSPTDDEIKELTREINLRILGMERSSYIRQFENGLLDGKAIKSLLQAVEVALASDELVIKIDDLLRMFRKQTYLHKFRNISIKLAVNEYFYKVPKVKFYRICYIMAINKWFDIIYSFITLVNVVVIIFEIILFTNRDRSYENWSFLTDLAFYSTYVIEFLIRLYAHSYQSILQGFKNYIRNPWNVLDFTILVLNTIDIFILDVALLICHELNVDNSFVAIVVLYLKIGRGVRLLKLMKMMFRISPIIIEYWDNQLDMRVIHGFSLGKALIVGFEEILDVLPKISNIDVIQDNFRTRILMDKLKTLRELAFVEMERPWIATTIKTKEAMKCTIKAMENGICELKSLGLIDHIEEAKLIGTLELCIKSTATTKTIPMLSPMGIFFEIPWLCEDKKIHNFLAENIRIKIWDEGEVIFENHDLIEGVFLIITGIIKVTYKPTKVYLDQLQEVGSLPPKEFLRSTRFSYIEEDYGMKGNSIGEISVLCKRPSSSTVVSFTPCQTFIIPTNVLEEALNMSEDPISGLESRMWKYVSLHMAKSILQDIPAYESYSYDQMDAVLNRAFIPKMTCFEVFVLTELIQNVILINGQIEDYISKDVYTAPTYIPRTINKLVLPKSSTVSMSKNINTKLMIIPIKDVDTYEVMFLSELVSDLVANHSENCVLYKLRHKVQKQGFKMSASKKIISRVLSSSTSPIASTSSMRSNISARSSKFQHIGVKGV